MRRLLEVGLFVAFVSCEPLALAPEALPRPGSTRGDALRPDSPNTTELPPNFAPGDVVEEFGLPDAGVLVHFTRAGVNAVPLADSNGNGTPDFVEQVAQTYRDVRLAYHGVWGFSEAPDDALVPQDNGGDDRFDVYLVDFAGRADGAFRRECFVSDPVHCTGYMVQENDFVGYAYPTTQAAIVTVSSHEYFHGVQAGYSALQGANVTEATAVWATERFDPTLNDLEGFSRGYQLLPERSIDQEPSTPVDGYTYGLALLFECLSAQHGPDTVLGLWSRIDGGAGWVQTLERQLAEDGGSFAESFERCTDYNVFTGTRARPGYGHARAAQLALATVTESTGNIGVNRARMFRSSSRYYHATGLPAGAVAFWRMHDDGPDGGALGMRVRLAADGAGAPVMVAVPPNTVTAAGATALHLLVTNTATGGPSVPVQLCVGSPAFVDGCRMATVDAGTDAGVDAGMPPPDAGVDAGTPVVDAGIGPADPPPGCGCNAGAGPMSLLLALALLRRSRRP
ncbi:MAG: hypothetical protein JNK82_44365 [Myxococcaceae bacterium]|nr:hypothetical protein [Myxococcaceae bacterium]